MADFTSAGIDYGSQPRTLQYFWLQLWHAEAPGPGIEPMLWQWPQPQQWQWWIINPQATREFLSPSYYWGLSWTLLGPFNPNTYLTSSPDRPLKPFFLGWRGKQFLPWKRSCQRSLVFAGITKCDRQPKSQDKTILNLEKTKLFPEIFYNLYTTFKIYLY